MNYNLKLSYMRDSMYIFWKKKSLKYPTTRCVGMNIGRYENNKYQSLKTSNVRLWKK